VVQSFCTYCRTSDRTISAHDTVFCPCNHARTNPDNPSVCCIQALRPGQDHASLTALLKDLHLRAAGMTKHAEAAGTTKRRPLHVVIDVRWLEACISCCDKVACVGFTIAVQP